METHQDALTPIHGAGTSSWKNFIVWKGDAPWTSLYDFIATSQAASRGWLLDASAAYNIVRMREALRKVERKMKWSEGCFARSLDSSGRTSSTRSIWVLRYWHESTSSLPTDRIRNIVRKWICISALDQNMISDRIKLDPTMTKLNDRLQLRRIFCCSYALWTCRCKHTDIDLMTGPAHGTGSLEYTTSTRFRFPLKDIYGSL